MAEETYQGNIFRKLLDRYNVMVYNYFRIMLDTEKAEELTQDTFLEIHKNIKDYNKKNAESWIFSIAHKILVGKKRKETYLQAEEPLENRFSEEEDKMSFLLRKSINALDDKYRIPIVYHYFFNKSYGEIAEFLDVTAGCVKTRIKRGREKLSEELKRLHQKNKV